MRKDKHIIEKLQIIKDREYLKKIIMIWTANFSKTIKTIEPCSDTFNNRLKGNQREARIANPTNIYFKNKSDKKSLDNNADVPYIPLSSIPSMCS